VDPRVDGHRGPAGHDRDRRLTYGPSMSSDRKRAFRGWVDGHRVLQRLSTEVKGSGLEHSLLELVKTRASQINGCAYCVDLHTKDARAAGETEQRLYALAAWRDGPFFTDRERASLALTEAVTRLSEGHPSDDVVAEAAAHFSPEELTRLLFAIIEINAWNRLAVTTGAPEPGSYEVGPS
jgi:AhpD family alkylhydroperoxidase